MRLAGVAFLDHTADVGMDVDAASLDELLHRSALGMMALLRGQDEGEEPTPREVPASAPAATAPAAEAVPIDVGAEGAAGTLAAWLRELLYLHEVRKLDYVSARLDRAEPGRIHGRVLARPGGHAAREIKGVTYHELQVARRPDGRWHARVIFDV